jgi:lipopolysaccharide export system permease protein
MRLLDRYVLREFLVPLGICLCAFLIFWVAFDLFSQLQGMQDKHLLARDVAEYYVFKAPEFLILVLPIALLLALLYTLTNHARHNEITAIRAAGVSLWRLCLPYLVVGLIASAILYLLNEYCVPWSADIADQILEQHGQQKADPAEQHLVRKLKFTNAREGRSWATDVYNTITFEMVNPTVLWTSTNGSRLSLTAERAVWTNSVWLFLGKVSESEGLTPLRRTSALAMPEFSETPAEIQSVIDINEYRSMSQHSRTRRADIPIRIILNYLRLDPKPEPSLRAWLHTKLEGRFAGPCACFVVVLIAVPFAAGSGRRNVFAGVAASIFIFFVYFILQQFGLTFGESGFLPPCFAAWFPNLFFGIAGLWMMMRVR